MTSLRSRETSKASFKLVREEGTRESKQDIILRLVAQGPRSRKSIAKALNWPYHLVTPRVTELVDQELLEVAYIDRDEETNRQVEILQVTNKAKMRPVTIVGIARHAVKTGEIVTIDMVGSVGKDDPK